MLIFLIDLQIFNGIIKKKSSNVKKKKTQTPKQQQTKKNLMWSCGSKKDDLKFL